MNAKSKNIFVIFCVGFLIIGYFNCDAQSTDIGNYVYKISIRIPNSPSVILQTGFRLKGTPGIITALHGVAVGDTCSAYNNTEVFNNLQISKINVDQDVVLLVCSELQSNDVGLIAGNTLDVKDGENLRAYGFPNGAGLYNKPVNASSPHSRVLNDLLDANLQKKISGRRSPNQTIGIMALDGSLGPGFSGGPILNESGAVVSVIDGGLTTFGNDWSIPLKSIVWSDADQYQGAIDDLKTKGVGEGLFSICYDRWTPPPPKTNVVGHVLTQNQRVDFLANSPLNIDTLRKYAGRRGIDGKSGLKGHDGRHGYQRSGKNGAKGVNGISGDSGEAGTPGENAKDITLIVDSVNFENSEPLLQFTIRSPDGEDVYYAEKDRTFLFNLSGGNGGNGGNGGEGGAGGAGSKGADGSTAMITQPAIAYNGGNGGNGGDGGVGGNGGDGGDGGAGGHVTLVWKTPNLLKFISI